MLGMAIPAWRLGIVFWESTVSGDQKRRSQKTADDEREGRRSDNRKHRGEMACEAGGRDSSAPDRGPPAPAGGDPGRRGPIDDGQCRLVRENMGLVAVHLRRYVANLATPRRDREWDDLFQEGCLGLIEAARTFREERGIPFAAYALPRIHNAVSKALHGKFATVRVPAQRAKPRNEGESAEKPGNPERRPTVCSLSDERAGGVADRRHRNLDGEGGETIGDRVRRKYDDAVALARDALSKGASTRGDRDKLVRILAEERFLVPSEESRRALRQIARDTRSSYARVAQYEKQLGGAIRRTLEADPEFVELQRRARADPDGGEVPIDEELETGLVVAGAEEFARRFVRADSGNRAKMLHAVLSTSGSEIDIENMVRTHFARLPAAARAGLLRQTADLGDRTDLPRITHRGARRERRESAKKEQT